MNSLNLEYKPNKKNIFLFNKLLRILRPILQQEGEHDTRYEENVVENIL
jgi:hypothetical protein